MPVRNSHRRCARQDGLLLGSRLRLRLGVFDSAGGANSSTESGHAGAGHASRRRRQHAMSVVGSYPSAAEDSSGRERTDRAVGTAEANLPGSTLAEEIRRLGVARARCQGQDESLDSPSVRYHQSTLWRLPMEGAQNDGAGGPLVNCRGTEPAICRVRGSECALEIPSAGGTAGCSRSDVLTNRQQPGGCCKARRLTRSISPRPVAQPTPAWPTAEATQGDHHLGGDTQQDRQIRSRELRPG